MGAIQGAMNRIGGSMPTGRLAATAVDRVGSKEPAGKEAVCTKAAR